MEWCVDFNRFRQYIGIAHSSKTVDSSILCSVFVSDRLKIHASTEWHLYCSDIHRVTFVLLRHRQSDIYTTQTSTERQFILLRHRQSDMYTTQTCTEWHLYYSDIHRVTFILLRHPQSDICTSQASTEWHLYYSDIHRATIYTSQTSTEWHVYYSDMHRVTFTVGVPQ